MTKRKAPRKVSYTRADVERAVEWSNFVDEISSDSDRGALLALAAKVEASSKKSLAKLMGDDPESEEYVRLPFESVIRRLEKYRVIPRSTADLLDELRHLRNAAAHSPKPFGLFDKKRRKTGQKSRSYRERADKIVTKLRRHVNGVKGDLAWRDHEEDGLVGDFKIALRLLWEAMEIAAREVKPLVAPQQPVVFDLLNSDPERFWVAEPPQDLDRRVSRGLN